MVLREQFISVMSKQFRLVVEEKYVLFGTNIITF